MVTSSLSSLADESKRSSLSARVQIGSKSEMTSGVCDVQSSTGSGRQTHEPASPLRATGGLMHRSKHQAGPFPQSVSCTWVTQQSLCGQDRRGALVLDQEHQEFRRLGAAGVPVDDMNIIRAFIEGLSWCQCHLLSPLQLYHDGALQHVHK